MESGFSKFDTGKNKGDFCYAGYYKFVKSGEDLKYVIYCYCYDFKEIMKDPELLEFSLECQIESEKGIFGLESIQWDFTNPETAKQNLDYYQQKIEEIWKVLGSNRFPV